MKRRIEAAAKALREFDYWRTRARAVIAALRDAP